MSKAHFNEDGVGQSTTKLRRATLQAAGNTAWLAAAMVMGVRMSGAQEGLRNSMAGQEAAEARHLQPDALPYTFKAGDFRLLATPSLGLDWNDNINSANAKVEQDVILRPTLALTASYPVTQRNLLQFNISVGYDKYFQHDRLSTYRLGSGSELSFDIFVKDVLINLHDRFSYKRDSAQEAAVANTALYGTLDNTVGLSLTWDLEDVRLSAGYDHQTTVSPASEFSSLDKATELAFGRAGFQFNPAVTAGVEGTASFTTYDQMLLNDNRSYSAGVYADWRPGTTFRVQPKVGYTIFQFQHTSSVRQTADLNSWYADLSVSHELSEAISYNLSAGHEVRLGVQSADAIEDWYFRPTVDWKIIRNFSLQTFVTYEHGNQGAGNIAGNLTETYDWFGGGGSVSHPITDKLTASVNYRGTIRSSTSAAREYTQNLVGLLFTYRLE